MREGQGLQRNHSRVSHSTAGPAPAGGASHGGPPRAGVPVRRRLPGLRVHPAGRERLAPARQVERRSPRRPGEYDEVVAARVGQGEPAVGEALWLPRSHPRDGGQRASCRHAAGRRGGRAAGRRTPPSRSAGSSETDDRLVRVLRPVLADLPGRLMRPTGLRPPFHSRSCCRGARFSPPFGVVERCRRPCTTSTSCRSPRPRRRGPGRRGSRPARPSCSSGRPARLRPSPLPLGDGVEPELDEVRAAR